MRLPAVCDDTLRFGMDVCTEATFLPHDGKLEQCCQVLPGNLQDMACGPDLHTEGTFLPDDTEP